MMINESQLKAPKASKSPYSWMATSMYVLPLSGRKTIACGWFMENYITQLCDVFLMGSYHIVFSKIIVGPFLINHFVSGQTLS